MKLFNQTIWAITPEMLQTMMSLAKENNKPPEAIAREMGKEMKDSNAASVRDGVCVIRLAKTTKNRLFRRFFVVLFLKIPRFIFNCLADYISLYFFRSSGFPEL